jgi:hypothetical protein
MLTDMNRMFLSRAWRAALLFAVALAFGALGARPGYARSVSAPSAVSQLLAFAGVPADSGDTGDSNPREPMEPKNLPEANPQNQQPPPKTQQPPPPSFAAPDTSSHADSIRAFPGGGGAPLETLGAPPRGPFVTNAAAGLHGPRPRRGVFGVPPLALLAGLIALHIFVVTRVVK